MRQLIVAVLLYGLFSVPVMADREVVLEARDTAFIEGSAAYLRDIASISEVGESQLDPVRRLGSIELVNNMRPGEQSVIEAKAILAKIREGGIDLNTVGYRFPAKVIISRKSRKLTVEEAMSRLSQVLSSRDADLMVSKVSIGRGNILPTNISEITFKPLSDKSTGTIAYHAIVESEDNEQFEVAISAEVDKLIDVPVAARRVAKGSTITLEDIKVIQRPKSTILEESQQDPEELTGLMTSISVSEGAPFKLSKLSPPPIIKNGELVSLRFRSTGIEAIATGTALEAGALGQEIKVRNNESKKVVMAIAIEPGLARVSGSPK